VVVVQELLSSQTAIGRATSPYDIRYIWYCYLKLIRGISKLSVNPSLYARQIRSCLWNIRYVQPMISLLTLARFSDFITNSIYMLLRCANLEVSMHSTFRSGSSKGSPTLCALRNSKPNLSKCTRNRVSKNYLSIKPSSPTHGAP
jgi:hypothetical protein